MLDEHKIKVLKLNEDLMQKLGDFDCGEPDLNEFLEENALGYLNAKLAVTYMLEYDGEIKAFFCLSDADIKVNKEDEMEFSDLGKHLPNYPAMLIGRLGVKKSDHYNGFGSIIIQHVIGRAITHGDEVGCRYLAVDSLNNERNLRFYEKNGFKRLIDGKKRENVPMYLDLLKIKG